MEPVISLNQIKRELYRRDLYQFVRAFWHTVEGAPLIEAWVLDFFCNSFMWIVRDWLPDDLKSEWLTDEEYAANWPLGGQSVRLPGDHQARNLNINIPPRHSKSLIFNVFGPAWLFTITSVKVASVSHTRGLSSAMNRNRQKIINSPLYKELFPEIWLTKDQGDTLEGNHLGELYSINMEAFTGYGADIIINDDIVSAEHAVKDMMVMSNAISYYRNTMPSRINNPEKGIIMNIQQRLAPGDVTGFISADPELRSEYVFVEIKALAEVDEVWVFPTNGLIVERGKGEPLWPERFQNYDRLRRSQGESIFQTQYQQEPKASDDTIVKDYHIKYMHPYDAEAFFEEPDMVYASHDFPVKDLEKSDMLGSVLAYRRGHKLLITGSLETKMAYTRSKEYVNNLAMTVSGITQIVEDKANGAPIIQELQGTIPGIIAFNPGTASKTQRLESSTVYMESGNVYFLSTEADAEAPHPDVANLVARLLEYPYAKYKDMIDAFSQLILYVFLHRRTGFFTNSFDEDNHYSHSESLALMEYRKNDLDVALLRVGTQWKALKVWYNYDRDEFVIVDELLFRANEVEAVDRLKPFIEGARMVVDATADNALYRSMMSRIPIVPNSDKRGLMTQLSQIQVGFASKKILVNKACSEFRRDLDAVALDKKSIEDGREKLTGDEGLIACLRVLIYATKGGSDFIDYY